MAQIAIKGHDTRGKEVIEIFEMLGGENISQYFGDDDDAVYTIEGRNIVIYELEAIKNDDFIVFTLEEFLEKYPYKVGDKVKACVNGYSDFFVIQDMIWYCISKVIKYKVYDYCWLSAENLQPYKEENLGECLFGKKETKEKTDTTNHTTEINFNNPVFKGCDEIELIIPDGWELKQIGDKMFGVRKQPQYPKTYEECCKVVDIDSDNYITIRNLYCEDGEEVTTKYERDFLGIFESLWYIKICRDAYWKIAGEQMGLGKPWEPDWNNLSTNHEFIKINKGCFTYPSRVLVFPTTEMRDAFHDNFKDLIEDCEELL